MLEGNTATGRVRVAFDARIAFCNPGGRIQGGFLVAMIVVARATASARVVSAAGLACG